MPTTELPADAQAALESARAAHQRGDENAAKTALERAFVAVDFPAKGPDPMFPLPDSLTPPQRALAEIVVGEGLPHDVNRLPGGVSARRWIGLDPPGPLETPVVHEGREVPIWYPLRLARRSDEELDATRAVPLPARLEVLACFEGLCWTYRIDSDVRAVWKHVAALDAAALRACREWALARLRAGTPPPLEKVKGSRTLGERLAFYVLAETGEPIEEAWDVFLPIATEVPPTISGGCSRALTTARVERVAPALLRQSFGPKGIEAGLEILRHHDSPAVARVVWEVSERSFPHNRKAERQKLAERAETKPAVAAMLAGAQKGVPAPRTLTVVARLAPKQEPDLSPTQAAQLVEAGRRWGGKKVPVARLLSVDENDEAAIGAVLEHLTIHEHGKHAFDAWLYMGDSGTFFAPGTTKVVAELIQGGIQLPQGKRDPALADALGLLRTSRQARRPLAEVKEATARGRDVAKATAKPSKAAKPATKAGRAKPMKASKAKASKAKPATSKATKRTKATAKPTSKRR